MPFGCGLLIALVIFAQMLPPDVTGGANSDCFWRLKRHLELHGLVLAGGGELQGEVNGLGAIREDGLKVEQDGRFHGPPS